MKISSFSFRAIATFAIAAFTSLNSSAFAQSGPAATPEKKEVVSSPKVTTQQHGDWLLECYDPAVNGVTCQIMQRVVHNESGQNILVMTMTYNAKEKSDIVQYVLPLDFLLEPGIGINIGDYQTVARANRCTAQGCVIEGKTDEAFINAMKAAVEQGRFVMMSRTGKKVAVAFSATGFTKAYNEMRALNSK